MTPVQVSSTDTPRPELQTCERDIPYDIVNRVIANNMTVKMYNLTGDNGFSDQVSYIHPWSTLLMEILAEARSPVPAGCNYQNNELAICVASTDNCNLVPYECSPAKKDTVVPGDGYDAILKRFNYKWVASWQTGTFSMLGHERLNINYIQPEIDAAILWACQQASTSVVRTSATFNPVSSAKGYVITFLINATAAIGAWLAYSEIAKWVSRTLSRRDSSAIGKFVAGSVTMVITVLPFVFIIISDFSINKSNSDDTVYAQQAFDAPGYGGYKIVAVAQLMESAESSALPLSCGLPLVFVTASIGFAAIIITEVVRKRSGNPKYFPGNTQMLTQHV